MTPATSRVRSLDRPSTSSSTRHVVLGVTTLLLAIGVTSARGAGSSLVVIDGDLNDMIVLANSVSGSASGCSFVEDDPQRDIQIFDPTIIPCVPIENHYYVNGADQVRDVLVYDASAKTLFLGVRVAGKIGDADGDGNPNVKCAQSTINDEIGIGLNDSYKWQITVGCTGAPAITIEVRANALTVTGATSGTKRFAFNGSDLEVEVDNLDLTPGFDARLISGNVADGLSEDDHQFHCQPPGPQIDVVQSASASSVCANTTFTIVVSNPGSVSLQPVTVVDNLPSGLAVVSGSFSSTCGVGIPVVVGAQLTWPNFTLAAGASCTLKFQAAAGAQCAGTQTNVAIASGSSTSACSAGGAPQVVQDQASLAVTCGSTPCVVLSAVLAPESAGPNTLITVSGTVQNCGAGPETIVVMLDGVTGQNFANVAPGATRQVDFQVSTGNCTLGQDVAYTMTAKATNACGAVSQTATRSVRCVLPPCVSITAVSVPLTACPNTSITVSGTVQNCGAGSETIVLSLNGGSLLSLGAVAAGVTKTFTIPANTGNCTTGQSVAYKVVATATNAGGRTSRAETRNVSCSAGPCVHVTISAPESACANAIVRISGTATNCSTGLEKINVTLNGGQPQLLGTVAAGATVSYAFQAPMPACVVGQVRSFVVVATATSPCGSATDSGTRVVRCKLSPCSIVGFGRREMVSP